MLEGLETPLAVSSYAPDQMSASDVGSRTALNVLLLNEFFYPDRQGGTATATSNIARHLVDDHSFGMTVITGRYGYRDPNERFGPFEDWKGVRIHRVGNPNQGREKPAKRFLCNIAFALQVAWKAVALPKPDVTLVTTAPLTLPIAARILKRLRGVPYVYVIYDLDPDRTVALHVKDENSRSVKLLRGWQRRWLHDADRVVAIGRCMKERLHRVYDVPLEKIDVIPVGADPDVIKPMEKDTEFRRKHGIEGFVVMYSGNFGQYHDFDTLLGAAELLLHTPSPPASEEERGNEMEVISASAMVPLRSAVTEGEAESVANADPSQEGDWGKDVSTSDEGLSTVILSSDRIPLRSEGTEGEGVDRGPIGADSLSPGERGRGEGISPQSAQRPTPNAPHQSVTFVLVGGGKKRAYVEQQVKDRHLTNVRLFDFVPEEQLSDLLASADMHVVTLEPGMEGICVPSKFYACLASARPVLAIMGPESEVARVVEESGYGIRIDIGDIEGCSQAIRSTSNDGNLSHDLFERTATAQSVATSFVRSLSAVCMASADGQ